MDSGDPQRSVPLFCLFLGTWTVLRGKCLRFWEGLCRPGCRPPWNPTQACLKPCSLSELAIHGTANPSSSHSHGPVQCGPVDGVCALSQTMEAGGEGNRSAVRAPVSASGCSCVFPQVNFKTSPNSSSSSEEPCTPATCVAPLWVRKSWERTGCRILSLSQPLCRLHSGIPASRHPDLDFILTVVSYGCCTQARPLHPGWTTAPSLLP